jgi:hypothetical protein
MCVIWGCKQLGRTHYFSINIHKTLGHTRDKQPINLRGQKWVSHDFNWILWRRIYNLHHHCMELKMNKQKAREQFEGKWDTESELEVTRARGSTWTAWINTYENFIYGITGTKNKKRKCNTEKGKNFLLRLVTNCRKRYKEG